MYRITGVIVIMLLFVSCGTFLRLSNKIEEPHYALYGQKALLVYAIEIHKVMLINPSHTRCYYLKGKQYTAKWAPGDTFIIDSNLDDFYSMKFARKCKF